MKDVSSEMEAVSSEMEAVSNDLEDVNLFVSLVILSSCLPVRVISSCHTECKYNSSIII